jgi:GTP-binding protein EngB required for normal cell division
MSKSAEIQEQMARLTAEALGVLSPERRDPIASLLGRLRTAKFLVLVGGEFKRGKSTLLNALLEEPGLFPVDVDVATSVPTTVTHGETEEVTVYYADGKTTSIGRADIAQYVTEHGNPGNRREVRSVEIRIPNGKLSDGLVLADTPGIGGVNAEHTAVTLEYLVNADALLFVASAEDPLNTLELDFLSYGARYCDVVVVAVTKIDRVADPDVVIADAVQKIADKLGIGPAAVTAVGVSSRRKLNGLAENDPSLAAKSRFAQLEQVLWDSIGNRAAAALVVHAGEEVSRALDLEAQPLGAELAARKATSQARRDEMAAELRQVRTRAAQLEDSKAGWRSEVAAGFLDLQDKLLAFFDSRMSEAEHNLSAYLADPVRLEQPQMIGSLAVRDIELGLADTSIQLRKEAAAVVVRVRQHTEFELSDPTVGNLSFDPITGLATPPPAERSTLSSKVLKAGPQALAGGKTYRKLGLLVGGAVVGAAALVVAAPIALAAGAVVGIGSTVVGAAAGLRKAITDTEQTDVQARADALRAVLDPFFADNRTRARQSLDQSIDEVRQQVVADLERRLRSEEASVREALAAVEGASQAAEDDGGLADLGHRIGRINELRDRVSATLAQALTRARRPEAPVPSLAAAASQP